MEDLIQKQIINKNFDLMFIKFPIIFPIVYGSILFLFPQYENILIFLTLLILAEPHFGATWPFFLNKSNFSEIKAKKIRYIFIPIVIAISSVIAFFYINEIFLIFFFTLNIFHVTRQSYGICKLYKNNDKELWYQEKFIYLFSFLFFAIGIFRFYITTINENYILIINTITLCLLLFTFIFYFIKFNNFENFLTFVTGTIIFLPACFVDKPLHAIIMGVTMHYTQYLALTYKICSKRRAEKSLAERAKFNLFGFKNYNFLLVIFAYGLAMSLLSQGPGNLNEIFKFLIIIPLTGQLLHFYLDAFLWKFSEDHNRNVTLKYIYSK